MNAFTTIIASPVARCALCGSERQFHGLPDRQCTTFEPLPSATAWHATDRVQRIIADMLMLSRIGDVVNAHYLGDADRALYGVADPIGCLERRVERGQPVAYKADGVVGDLLNALDVIRDDAIVAEVRRVYPASYGAHAEAYDELHDTLLEHFDTVAQAIEVRS